MDMKDFSDCLDTRERTEAELEALESEIARRFEIAPDRTLVIALDFEGKLDDSPLVSDWRATYARYIDWLDNP